MDAFNREKPEGIIIIMDLPSVENTRRQHININSESWLLLVRICFTNVIMASIEDGPAR